MMPKKYKNVRQNEFCGIKDILSWLTNSSSNLNHFFLHTERQYLTQTLIVYPFWYITFFDYA